jgi:hypothetical protein
VEVPRHLLRQHVPLPLSPSALSMSAPLWLVYWALLLGYEREFCILNEGMKSHEVENGIQYS